MTEQVLCIPRNRLPDSWVEKKSVIPLEFNAFADQCALAGYQFIDRAQAENDPSFKQIIPYVLIQTQDLSLTAVYNRQGSEKRLHDLWSLGIGGHINPIDNGSLDDTFEDILAAGMARELDEEIEKRPAQDIPKFSGVISEEITEVGRVHLGAVFRILTSTPKAYRPGPELYDFKWADTKSIRHMNMELWSELAMTLLFPV